MQKKTLLSSNFLRFSFVTILLSSICFVSALTVSPAKFELTVDPATSNTNEFTVINEQNADQVYYISVENFEARGESGTPSFSDSKDGLASWVTTIDKITIKKGEKVKIPFTINVPKDADAGGYFSAIFLSTVPPAVKGGEVSVGAKIGMLLLIRVSGDIKEDGGVESFSLKNGGRFATMLPIDFVYRFSNGGNDRVKPVGFVTINNMFGIETEKIDANKNEGNVLPGSIRKFELTWGKNEALPVSASFFSHVKYQMRNFAMGIYFSNLDLTFGTSKISNNSFWFVVLPWQLLIIIIIIGSVVFVSLRLMLMRYNKYIIKQARLANAK